MKQVKRSRQIFERAIEEYVAPALKEREFARIKFSVFYRTNGDCIWRIWSNYQDLRGVDAGSVFTTVCVGFRSISEFLGRWPKAPLDTDLKKPCTMAADLGLLRPPYNSDPIRLTAENDADRLGKFLWQDIRDNGFQYFEQFGTLEKSFEAWRKGTFFNSNSVKLYLLAAAHFLRGEKATALRLVDEEIERNREQIISGPVYVGPKTLPKDVSDLLNVPYDVIAGRTIEELFSFREFLLRME